MIIARVQRASVKRELSIKHCSNGTKESSLVQPASWFTRSRQPQAQLGPPWAVPEAQLFDDDEDPAGEIIETARPLGGHR